MFLENTLDFSKQTGWIEVVCGSMFSGKTEELIRRIRRAQFANLEVIIFKPLVDTRDKKNRVVSHDNKKIKCKTVKKASDIYKKVKGYKVVGIDEAQFFDDEITEREKFFFRPRIRLSISKLLVISISIKQAIDK